jgi:preprotein translocase subunit SecB|tara:strand:+ start:427 stop:858 length:432 start_codon:yes stop_codon:yes gene_type:complete
MTTMTKNFKVLAKYIKDVSSETPDIETFLFVKDNISKYQLNIDITSRPLKNKLIEVNITLKFEDKETNEKKSYFEIVYSSVVRINDNIKEKNELEKIILCDVPTIIYPDLEKSFLNLIHDSGHPNIKLEKKVDFQKLYKERSS